MQLSHKRIDGAKTALVDTVVVTALLDRLLHHAVVIQIERSSYRLGQHGDLVPEHLRAKALASTPLAPKRRGRPLGKSTDDQENG
jgi:IstB-like ATP binding protein